MWSASLILHLGKDYQIITISFNTKDTPEKAREKKVNFVQKISKENQKYWIYLTGIQENINTITDAVGFKYKAQGLDFAHASAIMVLSPQGKITRYLYGLTFLPFDVKMAIIEAQKGIARPTINKVLEYCFAYNPGSKTYTYTDNQNNWNNNNSDCLNRFYYSAFKKKKKMINLYNMSNSETGSHVSYLEYQGKYKGILSWLLTTDHKKNWLVVSVLYYCFLLCCSNSWSADEN